MKKTRIGTVEIRQYGFTLFLILFSVTSVSSVAKNSVAKPLFVRGSK